MDKIVGMLNATPQIIGILNQEEIIEGQLNNPVIVYDNKELFILDSEFDLPEKGKKDTLYLLKSTQSFYIYNEETSKYNPATKDYESIINQYISELNKRIDNINEYKNYIYVQRSAESIWNINHNLNKMPSVTVVDSAGSVVVGDITYIDLNNIRIKFSGAFSGKAFIN